MGDMKQVKVDNWGTFFLQRLKHFFNRTDYCDLTLQFQDNAQLKVHRLVLNACTEYFELLERTCEMYEDCLIMPDDLQADVVVPIVNFMYTGQLEYKYDLLDKLYQTAQIMNMSVLTKLLDTHRSLPPPAKPAPPKYRQLNSYTRPAKKPVASTSQQKSYIPPQQSSAPRFTNKYNERPQNRRRALAAPARPTRYELPDELDNDDIFENSFTDISYESKPLMTHPIKEEKPFLSHYATPSSNKFEELRKIMKRPSTSTADMVEFKRLKTNQNNSIFGESEDYSQVDDPLDDPFDVHSGAAQESSSQIFDHISDVQGAKVTIVTKSNNENSIDHAKIISEVLKKYPHLVKNNKNIKLKIVNSPNKSESKSAAKKVATQAKRSASPQVSSIQVHEDTKFMKKLNKNKDFTYETDITDTKEVAKLIALGVENVKGPWLCLICGTPGKALNFCSYHKFRNHLVEAHNERPPSNMCEFCGLKSGKRNHLLHHIYTKHGVPPPPSYHFPKCNQCSYIALTQGFLIKHKMTHTDVRSFNCNVCQGSFRSPNMLLQHIQQSGHKICPDRKANLQCIYCMKVFLRESNLYAHLKTAHKTMAKTDGIIDNSDDDNHQQEFVKNEPVVREETDHRMEEEEEEEAEDDGQYQIHQESDGKIQIINKKPGKPTNQTILNQSLPSFSKPVRKQESPIKSSKPQQSMRELQDIQPSILTNNYNERIVVLNQNEFLLKGNDSSVDMGDSSAQADEYIISDMIDQDAPHNSQTLNMSLPQVELSPGLSSASLGNTHLIHQKVSSNQMKNPNTVNQPYQIVVSSEQEYKALMAANPSIIFPDGTQSKALSVMAHGSDMTAANIDLDPSQNNNMMIIQEEYPMNVSEALTGDNSNIVVVYSHPLDSQGKQYVQYSEQQLINDQDIQGQLVSTSQVIPSMSSTSSIMNAGIIVQQPVQEWQNEEPHTVQTTLVSEPIISHITVQEESEPGHSAEQDMSAPTIVDKGLSELAELQILSQTADVITEVVVSQPSDIQQEELQDAVMNQSETEFQPENEQEQMVCVNQDVLEPVQVGNEEEVVLHHDDTISEMEVENQEEIVPLEGQDITESSIEEPPEMEVAPNEESTEENVESESSQEIPENETKTVAHTTSTLGMVNEQVQNLAAEWSDDETTSKLPEEATAPNETTEVESSLPIAKTTITENASEVEESIENIQQEMENQVTNASSAKRIVITSDITLSAPEAKASSSENVALEPTKKLEAKISSTSQISSLLNDWDDNDSQPESNGAKTPEKSAEEPIAEPLEEPKQKESDTKEVATEKVNKIESLNKIMSDWDDDEEKEE